MPWHAYRDAPTVRRLRLFDLQCTNHSIAISVSRRRDSDEYKRWKAVAEAEASGDTAGAEAALADLKLRDKDGNEIEKKLPGGKVRGWCCVAQALVSAAWTIICLCPYVT